MTKLLMIFMIFFVSVSFAQTNEIVEVVNKRKIATYNVYVTPNPSPNTVVVTAPEGSICTIYSGNGIYVGEWEIREKGLQLDNLGTGVFIAHVKIEGNVVIRRFVIL